MFRDRIQTWSTRRWRLALASAQVATNRLRAALAADSLERPRARRLHRQRARRRPRILLLRQLRLFRILKSQESGGPMTKEKPGMWLPPASMPGVVLRTIVRCIT